MNSSHPRRWKRRAVYGLILLSLSACAAVSLWFWTASARTDRALRSASLSELIAASQRDPDSPRVLCLLGARLRDVGQYEAARTAFKKAALRDNDSEDAWLGWAAVTGALGNRPEAFGILHTYLNAHPRSGRAHFDLARIYHGEALLEKAVTEALTAAQCDPRDVTAWQMAGLDAAELRQYSRAEEVLTQGIAQNPRDWRLHLALGEALSLQRRDEQALPCYREAARLAPDAFATQLGLGRIELARAKSAAEIEAARQILLRAAALNPVSAPAYRAIGESFLRQERWQEARTPLEQAERLAPSNPVVHFDLRRVYQHLGDTARTAQEMTLHQQALEYRNAKIRLTNHIGEKADDTETRLELARLCAAHGDYAEAAREYRHLIALVPNMKTAQRELAEIERTHPEAASRRIALSLPSEE
jgi:tetratricopeptide (TPR) repeat protein